MELTKEVLETINNDIEEINEALKNHGNRKILMTEHMRIDSKYQVAIKDWGRSLWGFIDKRGFDYEYLGEESLKENLEQMKSKLESFKLGLNTNNTVDKHDFIINNLATANAHVDIKISFKQVKKQLEEIGLSEQQLKEILDKINELEELYKSKPSKGNLWKKVGGVLKWLAEQSIQVAGVILPLVSNLIQ